MGYDEEEKDKWLRRRVTMNRKEVIFEYIMAQNVPKLTKDNKSQMCDIMIATDLKSKGLEKIKINNQRVAEVIGNEGNGVSNELLTLAD